MIVWVCALLGTALVLTLAKDLDEVVKWASILGFFVALVSLLVSLTPRGPQNPGLGLTQRLDQATEDLAMAVQEQWRDEAGSWASSRLDPCSGSRSGSPADSAPGWGNSRDHRMSRYGFVEPRSLSFVDSRSASQLGSCSDSRSPSQPEPSSRTGSSLGLRSGYTYGWANQPTRPRCPARRLY